jgi:hypothetical protein
MRSIVPLFITLSIGICNAFTITPIKDKCSPKSLCSVPSTTILYASSSPSFTNPTQEQSVELGIREWPQQTISKKSWEEAIQENQTLTRYILQGNGEVTVTNNDDSKKMIKKFTPGLLIEVNGPATVSWEREKSSESVIILTPSYEQGGLLIGVGLSFIVLCVALIAGVGN